MKYDIETLKKLSTKELIKLWAKFFETESPDGLHRSYLIKYITCHKTYVALNSQTQRKLDKLVEKYEETKEVIIDSKQKSSTVSVTSGTKLIKEYKGRKYEVLAADRGFEYNGELYKSLSAIANKITGTRWNGKKFFGVVK